MRDTITNEHAAEALARRLCRADSGLDPDTTIDDIAPAQVRTPAGIVYVPYGATRPLWTKYLAMAHRIAAEDEELAQRFKSPGWMRGPDATETANA